LERSQNDVSIQLEDDAGERQDDGSRDNSYSKKISTVLHSVRAQAIISSVKVALNVCIALLDCRSMLMSETASTSLITIVCVVNSGYAVAIVILHLQWTQSVCSDWRALKQLMVVS
jgi:hypothetical protein